MEVGGGVREIIYLSLHCHHQNDSCIKMGSDESHFNVSVGSDGQSHKAVSTNHNLFLREKRAEAVSNRGPSAYQPNALPLGQTGSPKYLWCQSTPQAARGVLFVCDLCCCCCCCCLAVCRSNEGLCAAAALSFPVDLWHRTVTCTVECASSLGSNTLILSRNTGSICPRPYCSSENLLTV